MWLHIVKIVCAGSNNMVCVCGNSKIVSVFTVGGRWRVSGGVAEGGVELQYEVRGNMCERVGGRARAWKWVAREARVWRQSSLVPHPAPPSPRHTFLRPTTTTTTTSLRHISQRHIILYCTTLYQTLPNLTTPHNTIVVVIVVVVVIFRYGIGGLET